VPGVAPDDDPWLRLRLVQGQDIVRFLSSVVPSWAERRLPFTTTLAYSPQPTLSLSVERVDDESVKLCPRWDLPVGARVHAIASLPAHVLVDQTVRPGLAPESLPDPMRRSGHLLLAGQEVPHFLRDVWPTVSALSCGRTRELLSRHRLLDSRPERVLVVQRREQGGVGQALAVPMLACGGTKLPAEEAARLLDAEQDFLRLPGGWLPMALLRESGKGRPDWLRSVGSGEPFPLTPAETLQRWPRGLSGAWARVEFPDIRPAQGATPEETARLHYVFLRAWGIPGGVVGPTELAGALRVRRCFHASERRPRRASWWLAQNGRLTPSQASRKPALGRASRAARLTPPLPLLPAASFWPPRRRWITRLP